jgi:hypothetical protein
MTASPPCARCLLRPADIEHDRQMAEWDMLMAERHPGEPRPERRTGLCRYCRSIAGGRRSRSCRHYPDRIYQTLVVKRSGIREVREVCRDCEGWWSGVKLKDVPNADQLPIWRDHRGDNPSCARCGNPDAEEHHWAPRELFDDAEGWPTDWLCPLPPQVAHDDEPGAAPPLAVRGD